MRKKIAALCTMQFAIFHLADDTITRITNIKRTECLKEEQKKNHQARRDNEYGLHMKEQTRAQKPAVKTHIRHNI